MAAAGFLGQVRSNYITFSHVLSATSLYTLNCNSAEKRSLLCAQEEKQTQMLCVPLGPSEAEGIVGGSAISQPSKTCLPLVKAKQLGVETGGHPPSSPQDCAYDSFQHIWALPTIVSPEAFSTRDAPL